MENRMIAFPINVHFEYHGPLRVLYFIANEKKKKEIQK